MNGKFTELLKQQTLKVTKFATDYRRQIAVAAGVTLAVVVALAVGRRRK